LALIRAHQITPSGDRPEDGPFPRRQIRDSGWRYGRPISAQALFSDPREDTYSQATGALRS
jgi:hypothetical protein